MWNKEIRNTVYRRAKELYENEPECEGMCQAIHEAFLEIAPENLTIFLTGDFMYLFPEFFELCPENSRKLYFWWPKENREIRLEKFDYLINLTK